MAKHNVLVNAVAPTFIETPMSKPMMEKEELGRVPQICPGDYPLGHLGKPEDVIGAVIYLASESSNTEIAVPQDDKLSARPPSPLTTH